MIKLELNKFIDGSQLAKELGLDNSQLWADENYLYIDADVSKSHAQNIFDAHVIKSKPLPTIEEKLANAGITLDELRAALGL